jgi:tetratricopeptide (TPR) repeat protein
MSVLAIEASAAVEQSERLCDVGRWEEAYAMLAGAIRHETNPVDLIRLKLQLVHAYSEEDLTRGMRDIKRKFVILDEIEPQAKDLSEVLYARALYERGEALHIDFYMGDGGDADREVSCRVEAAEIFERNGESELAALATVMLGITYHVVLLDRDTAEPILRRGYEMAAPEVSEARDQSSRHLGQILQERGDPVAAIPLLEESLRVRAEANRPRRLPVALHALAFAQLEAGDLDAADANLRRARQIGERYGNTLVLAMSARTEAEVAWQRAIRPALRTRTHP